MAELGRIGEAITAARPTAVAALLRYFRNLDLAEDLYQEASLRALRTWPQHGIPINPASWLILAGRNAGLDQKRREQRHVELPDEVAISDLADTEEAAAEAIDAADYRDDVLRLLFICCHPQLPAEQQIALALRVVSGLTVEQIARAFLVSESAMEQRITRAKARVKTANIPFESPASAERSARLAAVAAMVYLVFNEGYTTEAADLGAKAPLCEEGIRLARLLRSLFPGDTEVAGLLALLLLQHARAGARFDRDGALVQLSEQDRGKWDRALIAEGLGLIAGAIRIGRPGPYQVQASIAAVHSQASDAEATDWRAIEGLYAVLETMQPSPVVTLNRAVAVSKTRGPEAALAMIEPLEKKLGGYFYYHGTRGTLLKDLGRGNEARDAFERARGLANSTAEAAFMQRQLDAL
ncbi:MAG: RNA polymerase sigma factor [Hyphomicrobiaceae bacterium]|nr:MAG: RNA polymerase sigma factor [Hyphomicrobiaceae bacterium]